MNSGGLMLPVSTEQKLEFVALKIFCRVNRIEITQKKRLLCTDDVCPGGGGGGGGT